MIAFGLGVWRSAGRNRPLRVVGGLLVTGTVIALAWPPMHQPAVLAAGAGTLTDAMHIVWTIVTNLFFMLEMGFGAAAFGKRFRFSSIMTMVTLIVFGNLTGLGAPRMQANLPTPWIGVTERINAYGFMLWMTVLAVALLTHGDSQDVCLKRP